VPISLIVWREIWPLRLACYMVGLEVHKISYCLNFWIICDTTCM